MSPTLNEKIKEHCPEDIKEKEIYGEPQKKVKAAGKAIGNVLGVVNGLAVKPINLLGNVIGDKKDEVYDAKLS